MKNYKKILWWLVGFSAINIGAGLILAFPEYVGLCVQTDDSCIYSYIDRFDALATFLVIFFIPPFFLSLTLLFLREEIFQAWIKFARIYLPLSTLLILWAPSSDGSLFPIDKEVMSWVTSVLFLFISLILIAVKWWKLRKGDQKN